MTGRQKVLFQPYYRSARTEAFLGSLSQIQPLSTSGTPLGVPESSTAEFPPSLWPLGAYVVVTASFCFSLRTHLLLVAHLLGLVCTSQTFLIHCDSYFPVTSFDMKFPPSLLWPAPHRRWACSGHRLFFC